MDEERLREILRQEITRAFKDVGLSDDDAHGDVKDLRSLLKTYKSAQSTIIKTLFTFITLGVLSLISFNFFQNIGGGK